MRKMRSPNTAEDFRFTTKGDSLYAIEPGWPQDGKVTIRSLGSDALQGQTTQSIVLLGSRVQLPAQPLGKYAYVFPALQRETADAKQ